MPIKIILVLLIWSSTVVSQDATLMDSLSQCRTITDSVSRLHCYDGINKTDSQANDSSLSTDKKQFTRKMPVLLADLEEPRVFTAFGSLDFLGDNLDAILLGLGTRLKFKTFEQTNSKRPIDFNVIGLIKSQFDVSELQTRNNRGGALINTDFMVGGELVKAYDQGYLRLKYTHRSTHLGDEFLIDHPSFLQNRVNLSYETLDLLAYRDLNHWGAYLGSSLVVRSEPGSLEKTFQVQAGSQYRGRRSGWYTPLFGIDVKSWEASDWQANVSVKAGIEISGYLDRPLQLMFEYYDGKSPYGQFLKEDLEFIGLSVNHYW